jgi:REP element-mobilizing transposase RayT
MVERFPHLAHPTSFRAQPIIFLTVVAHHRRTLLANDSAHHILRGIWSRSGGTNGWYVGDYILMPDHVHLFARPSRDSDGLSDWVKMWKSVSSRQLGRTEATGAPVWQEEYFDRFVRASESYQEKWCYVRNNPVRAGLVADPDAWPYRGRIHDLGSVETA